LIFPTSKGRLSLSLCRLFYFQVVPMSQISPNKSHQKILILDFGSQVAQLIARRVREQQVYCELHSFDVSEDFIREFNPSGIILSGGPNSVYAGEEWQAPEVVFELGVPVLGICYGMQTMAKQLGGEVESGTTREFGYAAVRARGHSKLLDRDLQDHINAEGHGLLDVWMSHGDKVTQLPPGFKLIGSNESTRLPRWPMKRAASTRCSSIRKSPIR
jgi:GMP synthase (glutamine-hydrolysing)